VQTSEQSINQPFKLPQIISSILQAKSLLHLNIPSQHKQNNNNKQTSAMSAPYNNVEQRNSSIISTKSMKNGLKTLVEKYKEHDRQVNAAWQAYYGIGYPTQSAMAARPSQSRASSSASEESVRSESSPSTFSKAVKAVKTKAKIHHQSVNNAYASYYGDFRVHNA
jgi:hypothetical protein